MEHFWHAFMPLFIAFDGVGLLPIFWALSRRLPAKERSQAAGEAAVTAGIVTLVFLLFSRPVFGLMGLQLADIIVAGGAILLVLSLRDLLLPGEVVEIPDVRLGVVPIGVPLLAGPAVWTIAILLRERYGWVTTMAALALNVVLVWILLRAADSVMQKLGRDGAQVVSKIMSLVLTAFGVMLIREGLSAMQHGTWPL